jgi:hypothetical protein
MPSKTKPKQRAAPVVEDVVAARTILWCQGDQAALAEAIASMKGIEVIATGCPVSGAAAETSDRLAVRKCTDLRHDVLQEQPDLLVLLTREGVERGDAWSWLDQARQIVTLEPMFDGIGDHDDRSPANSVLLEPALRHGDAIQRVDEWREEFGAIRSVAATLRGTAVQGSLYARLVDGMDLIERMCGPVEMVDAAMSGPTDNQPANLRVMHGHVSVNARFTSNCCASLHVSDAGAQWARGITILGEGGCLRLTDYEIEWAAPDGSVRERAKLEPRGEDVFLSLLTRAIRSAIDPRRSARPPHPGPSVLAACEATRLSLNTGQGESPRKLLSMMG